jgi:acetyltransferase-like isoleucine patch superfamily enzyme
MLRKAIRNFVLRTIDLEGLIAKNEMRRLDSLRRLCQLGESSSFYKESDITNLQNDAAKITIGAHAHIRGHLQLFAQGGAINIGDYCYVGENSKIWSATKIEIGNRVLISHNVNIHDNISHPLDAEKRHLDYLRILGLNKLDPRDFDLRPSPVTIGDDVWIGFSAIILKGVTIGKGSIIGAGSLVTEDIPENVIVAGNPAKIIRDLK